MVKEPKFWFKWTRTPSGSGVKLKLQIADGPVEGFHVDPVNMDREDGLGELDCSYIGRYHCASGTYKSETNKAQKVNITRSQARSNIHNLGSHIWQMDFAQFWYVGMLFLVEFADWNGERIGRGCSASGSKENNGRTDAMKYHTGTTAANRDTYGFTQYRNIEGWWDNVYDWMDGCYYNNNGLNIIKNPAQFSDNANGVLVGKPAGRGYPSDFTLPTQSGLEWALYPSAFAGSTTTYVPDDWIFSGGAPCLHHGSFHSRNQDYGPFYIGCSGMSIYNSSTGCRIQERPPKAGSAPKLINFTIDGTPYQAEEGMTWGGWLESPFNTYRFYIGDNDWIFTKNQPGYIVLLPTLIAPTPTDMVVANGTYGLSQEMS